MNIIEQTKLMNQFVPQFYEMDPLSEELLPDGTFLVDGMEVLIENPNLRQDVLSIIKAETFNSIDSSDTIYTKIPERHEKALRNNRWCVISHVEHHGGETSFVAEYLDGTKKKRVMKTALAWIVKIGSVPVPFQKERDAAFKIVYAAILAHESDRDRTPMTAQKRAGQASDKIVDMFL
jgi:hypothetical protein